MVINVYAVVDRMTGSLPYIKSDLVSNHCHFCVLNWASCWAHGTVIGKKLIINTPLFNVSFI